MTLLSPVLLAVVRVVWDPVAVELLLQWEKKQQNLHCTNTNTHTHTHTHTHNDTGTHTHTHTHTVCSPHSRGGRGQRGRTGGAALWNGSAPVSRTQARGCWGQDCWWPRQRVVRTVWRMAVEVVVWGRRKQFHAESKPAITSSSMRGRRGGIACTSTSSARVLCVH